MNYLEKQKKKEIRTFRKKVLSNTKRLLFKTVIRFRQISCIAF